MGTTLTGTTPQDTYDSLIKVTNNGPLSSTARYLSDGLGNDSVLALSTSRVGIGTASPDLTLHLYNSAAALAYFESTSGNGAYVIWRNSGTSIGDVGSQLGISGSGSASNFMIASRSGDMILGSSSAERMRITSAGNVGIGTSSPAAKLAVVGGGLTTSIANAATTSTSRFDVANPAVSLGIGYVAADIPMLQSFNNLTNTATNLTINPFGGNIGMGTSSPAGNVHIASASDTGIRIQAGASNLSYIDLADTASGTPAGSIAYNHIVNAITFATGTNVERARIDSDGLKFNGDTAAANALDDYEEGTFTPTIIGSTTAGTATYGGGQEGKYTKIGNVVYFQIYLGYSGGTGTGDLRIAGLPLTVPANDLPSFTFGVFLNVALTASNVPIAGGIGSTNQIYINQIPTGGGSQTSVPYDGSGVIQISGFYRV